jgi:predicted RNA binding protein YcfA (HicA-like mRNA interferase family)
MNSRDVIKALAGTKSIRLAATSSSNARRKKGRATAPQAKRDLPIGTLKSIEKQAGIKLR